MKPLLIICLTIIVLILVACSESIESTIQTTPTVDMVSLAKVTVEISNPDSATEIPIPTLPSTPFPDQTTPIPTTLLWVAEYIPEEIKLHLEENHQVTMTRDKQAANLVLDIASNLDDSYLAAQWVFVLVAPFPTITDGIQGSELRDHWEGNLGSEYFEGVPLRMDQGTFGIFSALWGEPAPGAVQVVLSSDLIQTSWENQPSWAIVPFEKLDPRWKVLKINGLSPTQKDFDLTVYPLTVEFVLNGGEFLFDPVINFDPGKLSDIMLTGVTALVRGTALTMERRGITYPGEDIAPITRQVDFMHVNNEVPFTPDCPFPELYQENLVFCSDPSYLELLESIGTDFVEVSGDHFSDHGSEGTLFTLDLYDEIGLPYYGGGRDLEDARKPILIDHHGNKVAVLGCNAKGSAYYAPADENTPGAVLCDFDWLEGEIARLIGEGYLVIVTLQHIEYYSYEAQPDLVKDFGRVAAAGAIIVSGSQSHQAHGMTFTDGAFIHYGLGNLFFDQFLFCEDAACDYGFMDRHIFYDGRYISTELNPIRFIDMARPRLMTDDERAWFLDMIFKASGW
jgi:poly-gamma-glutamate synthesis protein (capsule biosynthesis protein)